MNGSEPRLIRASTVNPVPVDWLWRPWLPRGKLVILDGNPDNRTGNPALPVQSGREAFHRHPLAFAG